MNKKMKHIKGEGSARRRGLLVKSSSITCMHPYTRKNMLRGDEVG